MKNKTGTTKSAKGRVPQLRFPEFRNAPAWEEKPLDKLADRICDRNSDEKIRRVLSNSAEYGVVDQRDYFDKDIANKNNLDGYYIVDIGDYVYNPRVSISAPVGPISKNEIGCGIMSPLYTVFRFKSVDNRFFAHYFKSSCWHPYLRQVSNSGARHDRMSITNDEFMAMPLPDPSPEEQQKIAECLASVDGLIAAQARKVDALKLHKKGLMQQLFPAEGKTVPALRFPEFCHAPAWKEIPFGKACESISSGKDKNDCDGHYDLYGSTGIIGKTATATFDGRYILVARVGANAGLLTITNGSFGVTDNTLILCLSPTTNIDFTFYYLDNFGLNKLIFGSGQPLITGGQLKAIPFLCPSELEQRKIAECLSSVDGLIAAQARKLDALKLHKKGLMQQLFPAAGGELTS